MPARPSIPLPSARAWTRVRRSEQASGLLVRSCVLPGDGPRRTALVVEHGDEVRVYENRCPHWSVPLDGPNGVLLTEDAVRLRCSVHGAEFLWQDGRCVAGPCEGAHLQALPSRLENDMIIIERPPLTAGTSACEA